MMASPEQKSPTLPRQKRSPDSPSSSLSSASPESLRSLSPPTSSPHPHKNSEQNKIQTKSPSTSPSPSKSKLNSPKEQKISEQISPTLKRRPIKAKASGSASKSSQPSRARETKKTHDSEQEDLNWNGISLIAFIVLTVICGFKWFIQRSMEPSVQMTPREAMSSQFDAQLQSYTRGFSNQPPRVWSAIRATTKAVLKANQPGRPGITMVIAEPGAEHAAECLVSQLSIIIHASYNSSRSSIVFSQPQFASGPESKMLLDAALNSGFLAGSRVAWIQHLENLQGEAAMMLHGYCDGDFANFKDAHYFFTVNSDAVTEEDVEKLMQSRWQSFIHADQFSALWSRIANNIVFVKKESNDALKVICSETR